MKRIVFMCAVLMVGVPMSEAVDAQQNEVERITSEIERLHKAGAEMHGAYNLNDDNQLMACARESRPLRAAAKPLRQQAMQLNDMAYRAQLVPAAEDAFTCVYCSDDAARTCDRIPPVIEKVRQWLATEE